MRLTRLYRARMGIRRERTEHGWPWWLPRGAATDALLALFLAAMVPFATVQGSEDEPRVVKELDALGFALLVATALPLVARRRRPVAVTWLVVAVTLTYILLDYWPGPILMPWGVTLYTVAAYSHRVHGILAGLLITAAMVQAELGAVTPGARPPDALSQALTLLTWAAIAIIAGEVVRTSRRHAAQAEQARQQIQQESALRRVEEERLRIAREVHDVLSHSISMISLQAGVAVRLFDRKPEQAREAMVAVRQTSKEAMEELRATLGALREDEDVPRLPAPSLDRIDALVSAAAQAGVPVEVCVAGERRKLPARVDAAAYRIVQEAFTNVARHAGPATATVTLTYRDGELGVEVDDTGKGVPAGRAPGGSGLAGLRERVLSVGGELDAGPRPEGGFRVRVNLPAMPVETPGQRSPDRGLPDQGSPDQGAPDERAKERPA